MNAPPRALGLIDVILMTVVSVVSLRWIARGAAAGAAALPLWLAALLLFFVPLAIATAALSRRHPAQGGIYAWTRLAFGPRHAFLCGWCLWVNNLFYFPSLLLFGAANAIAPLGPDYAWLAQDRVYSSAFVLVILWMAVGINIIGWRLERWVQNVGSLGVWIPAALVIGAGAWAYTQNGLPASVEPSAFVPRGQTLTVVALWSAMCFAFSGLEISALVGQEVRRAERTIPRGVLIGGGLIAFVYLVGTTAILVTVPATAFDERGSLVAAVESATRHSAAGLTGALLAVAAVAGTVAWMAGAARVPFAAGVDRALPAAFSRLHPRWQTPAVALIVQGAVSSLIFISALATAGTSVQEAYDVLVNLTILIYFVPYLYLFAALPALTGRSRLAAGCGLFATGVSLALIFVPPAGADPVAYEVSIVVQAALVVGAGYALRSLMARRRGAHAPEGS